jgi:hypothetical protein
LNFLELLMRRGLGTIMGASQGAKWGLERDLIADIQETFVNAADICRQLDTHAQYWKKFLDREGVKKSTATKVARKYLRVLGLVNANEYNGSGIDLGVARRMFKKYEAQVASEDTTLLLVEFNTQRQQG